MQSFATLGAISNAMQSVPDDSAKRHLLALVNRDVYGFIYVASNMDDTELSEQFPEHRDNEELFQFYIGGKVVLVNNTEELEALRVDGEYRLDRAVMVEGDQMVSLALCTNDGGGDLYYVEWSVAKADEALMKAFEEVAAC